MKAMAVVFGAVIGSILFSGCKGAIDLAAWVNHTEKLKLAAQTEGAVIPYREKQYAALKPYFYEIEQIALAIKNDDSFSGDFNESILKSDLAEVCRRVFIQKDEWDLMMKRCHKNRYFLCSEEVRAYPDRIRSLRESMTANLQAKFDELKECSGALNE